jgi:hypothetical protein
VAAVGDVPDLTGDEMAIGPGHGVVCLDTFLGG